MSCILDACFLIDLARGDARARGLLDTLPAGAMIPAPVIAQVVAGTGQAGRMVETLKQAAQLIEMTVEDGVEAGRLARRAQAEGRFPGWDDIFIAGMAAQRKVPVVTRNVAHFPDVDTVTY